MIDSHCHLTAPEFSADIDEVIQRALHAGIEKMITISDEASDFESCRILAEKYDQIFYTIGVHPHHASTVDLERDLPRIRSELSHPKCRAVGEIGLDYHYMNSPKDVQQRVFESQLFLATELGLPAVVHCREAVEDVWSIVEKVKPQKLVIHCCTEKWDDISRFVKAGYLLSFTGIVTYPKSTEVRDTVLQCPLSQMMLETDAPFLAPVPHRGKRCEPMYVIDIAKKIAEIKGADLREIDRLTTQTAKDFFRIPT